MSHDKDFEESFPALSREMREGRTKEMMIDQVRQSVGEDIEGGEAEQPEPLERTFVPDIVDYIRRCDTVSQALEIVDYMLKRGEISNSEARDIKTRLKGEGLRSFGEKKEKDHYLRHGLE
jgi:hypothetical protein